MSITATAAPADRTVARNFLALGSGEVLARVIAFGATVYIAQTLGPSFYGIIGFATAVTLYLNRVADGGLELGLGVREIALAPNRLQELAPALLTARLLVACVLVVATLLVGVFLLPQPDGTILGLYSFTLLAVGVSSRWIYLGMERARLVALARAIGEAAMVIIVLLLVHNAGDLADVPIAQFAGDTLAALILLVMLRRRGLSLRPAIRWSAIKPLLPRASALVASSFFGLAIYNSDLIFLRFFRDTAAVGYYAAAYTLVSFLINLGIAYSLSLLPTLTRLAKAPSEQKELYQSAVAQVFALGFPIALGGMLLAPAIIALFFGSDYAPSTTPLQLLFWAVPLSALKDVPIVALMSRGQERIILRQTAWAAGLNLALNLALIPRFGMIGAAVATVLTETVRMVMAFLEVRRHGLHMASFSRLSRPLIAGGAMAALLVLVRPSMLMIGVFLGLVTYLLSLTLLGAIRFRRGALPALHV